MADWDELIYVEVVPLKMPPRGGAVRRCEPRVSWLGSHLASCLRGICLLPAGRTVAHLESSVCHRRKQALMHLASGLSWTQPSHRKGSTCYSSGCWGFPAISFTIHILKESHPFSRCANYLLKCITHLAKCQSCKGRFDEFHKLSMWTVPRGELVEPAAGPSLPCLHLRGL